MIIPVNKINDMLSGADWETTFADTGKSYVELYDDEYDIYVHERCYTDDDIRECNLDQEAWAIRNKMLTFAELLAIYLLEQEVKPLLGSDYRYKICALSSDIVQHDIDLPVENIQNLKHSWQLEQELVERELLHLNALLLETEDNYDAKTAVADQLVHWHIYRKVISKLHEVLITKKAPSSPPQRREGESVEKYKARMLAYLNTLEDTTN